MTYSKEFQVGIEATGLASKLGRLIQVELATLEALEKKDKSPVTVGDFAAQAVVCHFLKTHFPHDPVVAEESASDLESKENQAIKDAVLASVKKIAPELSTQEILDGLSWGRPDAPTTGRFWTLDPIDGTKGFLRGQHYATALGLIEKGEVVVGILGCPNFSSQPGDTSIQDGCLFGAVLGKGTEQFDLDGNSQGKIKVAEPSHLSEANFCESVEAAHSAHGWAGLVAAELGVTAEAFRMDSQCKYAAVARGDAAIYLRLPTRPGYQDKIWDHAAGSLVTTEAGGRVTDIFGENLDFGQGPTLKNNKGIIATSGRFHEAVVEAVRKFKPENLNS